MLARTSTFFKTSSKIFIRRLSSNGESNANSGFKISKDQQEIADTTSSTLRQIQSELNALKNKMHNLNTHTEKSYFSTKSDLTGLQISMDKMLYENQIQARETQEQIKNSTRLLFAGVVGSFVVGLSTAETLKKQKTKLIESESIESFDNVNIPSPKNK